MSFTLYLGCVVKTMFPEVEKAVKETLNKMSVSFEDVADASCCAPFEFFSVSRDAWLKLNERNMRLFKDSVITVCDDCFASLSDSGKMLSEERKAKAPEIKPFESMLLERLKDSNAKFVFTGLRCAVQHSCHLLRPSAIRRIDNPEAPRIVKDTLEKLGYLPISYEGELECCGGLVFEEKVSAAMARRKVEAARRAGADCMVTTCSHCLHQLSSVGVLPVLHLSQLSALSMGSKPSEIGVPEELVERVVKG